MTLFFIMKGKILGTLYTILIMLLIVGLTTDFSFGFIGRNQEVIVEHYKKAESY